MKLAIVFLLSAMLFVAGCSQNTSVTDPAYMQDHAHHMQHKIVSEESFIADMIPHHQEAVDTSARLNAITQNPVLQELTQAIVSGQTAEITMMQSWLDTRYPTSSYVSTYTPMMRDTSAISAISTIEKMWLEDMIVHHMGAVMMAEDVLKLNPRPEVEAFARAIIDVQTNEIMLMQSLLQKY